MATAKVFQSGNSQAIRLPKEFRFDTPEVEIFRRGQEVILRARPVSAAAVFDALAEMPDDLFPGGREDSEPQVREEW